MIQKDSVPDGPNLFQLVSNEIKLYQTTKMIPNSYNKPQMFTKDSK